MSMTKFWSFGFAALCMLVTACGGDDEKSTEKCPEGFVAGQTQQCVCGDTGVGVQTCQADGNLDECNCTGGAGTAGTMAGVTGGTAGTTAGVTASTAGTTSTATSGTGATDQDGGPGGTAGTGGDGGGGNDTDGGPKGSDNPKDDGTQLSTCDPNADTPCEGDLICYTAGTATTVGYCTATCMVNDDCMGLDGATYTCSAPSGPGGNRACRIECEGEDDDSCPDDMSCVDVMGAFRCLYDEKDVGDGTAKVFEECSAAGDCSGDLVCYNAVPQGAPLPGGATYSGHCAQPCENNDECTEEPGTGSAELGCSTNSGACRLTCGGMAGDCPDGMTCVPGLNRCQYSDGGGGI